MEQPFDGTPFVVTAASQENTGQIQIGRRLLSALKFSGKSFFFSWDDNFAERHNRMEMDFLNLFLFST